MEKNFFDSFIKLIFGNPWIFCFIITSISTAIVWINVDNSIQRWNKVLVGFLFGLSIGIIYIFEIKLKGGKTKKRIFGSCVGIVFGLLLTFLLHFDPIYYFIFSIVGLFLGATARDWSKHINFF